MITILASDHIHVQPGSTDVLADHINQQYVDGIIGQARHPLFGQQEQLLFPQFQCVRCDRPDSACFTVAVLDDFQAGHDRTAGDHFPSNTAYNLSEWKIANGSMVNPCTGMLAQPNQHHLHQTTFDVPH